MRLDTERLGTGRLGTGRGDPGRHAAVALLATSAVGTCALLFFSDTMSGPLRTGVLAGAFAALGAVLANPRWRATLTVRGVMIAGICLTAVAVAAPPAESKDVWSYAFYGRTVVEYGESPYTTAPDDHPEDPYYERIGPRWRDAPSVYGPAFSGASIGIMAVADDHVHVARLLFQLLAAAAAIGVLVLIARETRSATAVAALGLNPLIIYSVVNSAHNDMIIGLCVLGAALLVMRERVIAAAFVLAVAALIKLSAVVALPALVVWIWYRRGLRRATAAGASGAAIVLVALLVAGGSDVSRALSDASDRLSWASIWQVLRPGAWDGAFSLAQRTGDPLPSTTATVALVITVLLALWLAFTHRRDTTPTLALGGALVAYLLVGAYVLPWYAAWALPVLALRWRAGLSLLVAVLSALWAVGYQYELTLAGSSVNRVLWLLAAVTIACNLAAIVVLVVLGWRRERDARRAERSAALAGSGLAP